MTPLTLPQRHGRSTITVHGDVVVKEHADIEAARREAWWYDQFPWACPRLLGHSGATLVIERHPVAAEEPEWRPVAAMRALLERLHLCGVHHRDVHAKNVVRMPDDSPRLIDWETATMAWTERSYDLAGPEASGIDKPVEHEGYSEQWWGGPTRWSLGRFWEAP